MEVYGTNCVKFAGLRPRASPRSGCARELRIVEPKLVVVMGEDALEFLNGHRVPARASRSRLSWASCSASRRRSRRSPSPTSTPSLDEAPAKTAFWNAFKTVGPWWAALPPY